MKIVYVSTGMIDHDKYPAPNRGGQVQIWGFAKELAKRGHDITILKADINASYDDTLDGVHILGLNTNFNDELLFGIPSQFIFSKKSVKIIKDENPEILNFRFRFSSYFQSKLNIPTVFTVASPEALDYMKPYSINHSILNVPLFHFKKIVESEVMNNSDQIIALNKFMADYLKNIGYSNKVKMIPNAIDLNDFYNTGDENFILYSGRFDWNKRVDMLINAFSMLDPEYKKVFKLILVGRDWDNYTEKSLKKIVKVHNLEQQVVFIPWVERTKLIQLMSKCSIFVLPSLFETFGIVVLEAMACGKTVIASNTPGPQDIITHSCDGFLFAKDSVEDLKKYLELCISDKQLRKEIGTNARKTVENKYTFERLADIYEKSFESVLGY